MIWRSNRFADIQSAEVTVTMGSGDGTAGVVLLARDGNLDNCFIAVWRVDSGIGTYRVYAIVNGISDIGTFAVAPTSGTIRIKGESTGTGVRLYADGVLQLTRLDASFTSGDVGIAGWVSTGSAITLDDFSAEPSVEDIPNLAYDHRFLRGDIFRRPNLGLQPYSQALRRRFEAPPYVINQEDDLAPMLVAQRRPAIHAAVRPRPDRTAHRASLPRYHQLPPFVLDVALTIIIPVADLIFAGVAPTIAGTGTATIPIPPGDITFAGVAPDVAVGMDPLLYVDINRRRWALAAAGRRGPPWQRPTRTRTTQAVQIAAQTIAIPPGDLVITGVAPTVTGTGTATILEPTGAITFLGISPFVSATGGFNVQVPTGALTIDGVAPAVTTGMDPSLIVDQNRRRSTLAIATRRDPARPWLRSHRLNVPLVAYPQTIAVPPGDIVLTGVEPDVTAGMDIALIYDQNRRRSTVNTATRRAPVQRPAVRRGGTIPGEAQTIPIPPADLTLVGVAPIVAGTGTATIAVPPGALTITGVAPVVTATGTATIPVPPGPVTLTGVAPVVTSTGTATILAPTGQLTINGISPFVSSTGGFNVQIPTGALTLTGVAPVVAGSSTATILVPPGLLTIDGIAPDVTTGMDPALYVDVNRRRSTLAVAVRRLPARFWVRQSKLDPNLIAFPQTIAIPPGDLTLTGVAPVATATGTATILTPVGALTIDGVAPSVAGTGTATILAPVGLITLTGVEPTIFAGDDPVYLADANAAYRQAVNTAAWRNPDASAPWKWMLRRRRSDRQGGLLPSAVAAGFPLVPNVNRKQQLQVRLVAARRDVNTAAQRVMAQRFHSAPPAPEAQTIDIPTGDLTLTGVEPVVAGSSTATILAPIGALTLTGVAPTISAPATIAIPPGTLTITGVAPTVTPTGTATILAPVGALTLAGVAPAVTVRITIAIPPGALALTGVAPVVTATGTATVLAPTGQITISGRTPTVAGTGTRTIPAPTGTITLTGVAPTVDASTRIEIPPGQITLTGVAPVITATGTATVLVPTGTLTINGVAPFVSSTGGFNIQIPTGLLTLTGVAPITTGGAGTVTIPTGTLTLTGVAPIVTATGSATVLVPTAQVTLSGAAPSVSGTGAATSIEIPTGDIILVGAAPGVLFRGTVSLEVLVPTCTLEVLAPTVELEVLTPTVDLDVYATIVTLEVLAPTVVLTQSAD
jgi:hypothetical protein